MKYQRKENEMISAINYFGGKNTPKIRNAIIDLLSHYDHKIYVEVFGGGAAVLLNKPPSPTVISTPRSD